MRIARTLGFLCGLGAALPALAQEQVSTMSRSGLLQSQIDVLEGRAAGQYANSVRLQPPRDEALTAIPRYTGSYVGPFLTSARAAATRHGVPADLFLRLVQQESGWNPNAVSSKGALGLAQLMPATARALGVDPLNPEQNLDGGARYLRTQYETFGSWPLALAAYNAGPGAITRYGGVPPFAETQNYVQVIWGR
ncbi:lytic transglycosylase domain-containing protein [Cognatiyoonia sp. IB215446]|uniref:lytic transglycosylase domain-containing protein n=1 Tax=Cognatiyoonia sp. IB215446 TaxID=3097355 RepID=UPI002A115EB6|nr:lytic transglycosylase domain-containing protein [Cognatiyoonia sp. IB215446]MDX8349074.1 lytic transglycosylase domain-containing protein [Cognatiyoonia sp. IB215446]